MSVQIYLIEVTAVVAIGIKTSLAKVWCILISAGLMLTQLEEATLSKAERPTSYKSLLVLLLLTTSIDGNSSSSVRYKGKNAQNNRMRNTPNTLKAKILKSKRIRYLTLVDRIKHVTTKTCIN
uniref:Uncharacterized protein n=1 Tax=Glossina pallidipes TaxID=7398 RepID=A0A1B0A465_GLOPL